MRAKRIIFVIIIAVFAAVAIFGGGPVPSFAAGWSIIDKNGAEYSGIADVNSAIGSAAEGSELEFEFSGEIPGSGHITISKNVNVIIRSGDEATSANVIMQNNGGGKLTVTKGGGDFSLNGYIDSKNGELDIDGVSIYSTGYTYGIGLTGELGPVKATVSNVEINTTATGIYMAGNRTKLESLYGSNIKGRHGMEVYRGADIGTIDNCTIEGSFYGIRIQAGHDNSTIYTEANNANIDVGSITNSTIKVVKLPNETISDTGDTHFSALAATSWAHGETNVHIGLVDNCTVSTDATHSWKGAVGLYSYSDYKDKPPRGRVAVDVISNCKIDSTNGSSGIFNQSAEIGQLINNTVDTRDNGSALAIPLCAYTRIDDPNISKNACGHIGIIKGGTYTAHGPSGGRGIYSTTYADDKPTIGKIEGATIEGCSAGIYLYTYTGNIGDIVDSTILQTKEIDVEPNKAYWENAAIVVNASSEEDDQHIHIGNIINSKVDAKATGIYLGGNNKLAGISNSEIVARFEGIYNTSRAETGDITDSRFHSYFNTDGLDPDAYYGVEGNCIQSFGAMGDVKNCELTTEGGIGISQRSHTERGYIGCIENVSIKDISAKGGLAGIYSEGSAKHIPYIKACTIDNYTTGIRNFTNIDIIEDNTITNVGQGIRTSGEVKTNYEETYEEFGVPFPDDFPDYFDGKIGTLKNNRIISKNQSVLVTKKGKIDEIISGWYENTAGDDETVRKSLSIQEEGSRVGTVSGGTFVGSGDAVFIDKGTLGTIIGSSERFPVFYGKDGYAINNENEGAKINIEPNLSEETIGYARYLGTKERQIINLPDKDTYPVHARDGETYFMSEIATDSKVKDLEGKAFHYLTVYVYLDYDKNAEDATGDMTDDRQKVEAGTEVEVAVNRFVRPGYAFTNWDTDPAGSGRPAAHGMKASAVGRAYDPGDEMILMQDTTLYAQWQKPASPTDPTDPTDPIDPTDPTNPTDPTDPDTPEKTTDPKDPGRSTSTGDEMPVAIMLLMLVASAGAAGTLKARRRRRSN